MKHHPLHSRGFTQSLEAGVRLLVHFLLRKGRYVSKSFFTSTIPFPRRTRTPAFSAGFTLVETLVAISVLMLSVVGPMTIASRALQSSLFAKDQITAFYLGQEAVEIIRAVRDDNAFNEGTDWLSGLSECTSGVCGVDVQTWTFRDCTNSEDCRIYYDPDGLSTQRGIYTHVASGNDLTRFIRTIRINEITNDQEAEIIVDVSWQTGTLARTVTIQSRIFNQFDNLYGTP